MTKFEIYFSEGEQIDFLKKHGWTIEQVIVEFPEQVHGSQFSNRIKFETSASKEGEKFYLQFAFSKQMAKCLLDL